MFASGARPPSREARVSRRSILIADDNLSIRKGLSQLFGREADFKVCAEAQNGREAVEKALQFRPDLIVLDLSMPVMNGLDAAQELKQLMPSVPLIMFTSYASPSLEAQTLMAGISALVSKSQHAAILVSTARSLLTPRAA